MNKTANTLTHPKTLLGKAFIHERMSNYYKKINSAKPVIDTNIRSSAVDYNSSHFSHIKMICEKLFHNEFTLKHSCVYNEAFTFRPKILPTKVCSKLLSSEHYKSVRKQMKCVQDERKIELINAKTTLNCSYRLSEDANDISECLNHMFAGNLAINDATQGTSSAQPPSHEAVDLNVNAACSQPLPVQETNIKPILKNNRIPPPVMLGKARNYKTIMCYSEDYFSHKSRKTFSSIAAAKSSRRFSTRDSSSSEISDTRNSSDLEELRKTSRAMNGRKHNANTDVIPKTVSLNEHIERIRKKKNKKVRFDNEPRVYDNVEESELQNIRPSCSTFDFLKDITGDILMAGTYSDFIVEKIIQRHVKKNKYNLEECVLRQESECLKLVLGISSTPKSVIKTNENSTANRQRNEESHTMLAVRKLNVSSSLKYNIIKSLGIEASSQDLSDAI